MSAAPKTKKKILSSFFFVQQKSQNTIEETMQASMCAIACYRAGTSLGGDYERIMNVLPHQFHTSAQQK